MSAAWVAGCVRARLLLGRRAGVELAREAAARTSLAGALAVLASSSFAAAGGARTVEQAQRAVAERLAVELRLLAAWLPRAGAGALRALCGWFEISNVEDRLAYLTGGTLRRPFELGILSSVWTAASGAQSPQDLRAALAASSWGDPGGESPAQLHVGLRLGWARRVHAEVPEARAWAAGAAAILLAELLFLGHHRPDAGLVRRAELGTAWPQAASVDDLRRRLPRQAAWALAGVSDPAELWRAELAWWQTVAAEAQALVRSSRLGRGVVTGAAVLLALDALRVSTALAVAAGGSRPVASEILDGLC
jgi:hypothetical protein